MAATAQLPAPHTHMYNYDSRTDRRVPPTSQHQPPSTRPNQQSTLPTPASSASNTPSTTSPISPPHIFPNSLAKTTSSSTSATSNQSILTPNFGFQPRQLRPARSPLYVPAVLRPTEPYGAASPKRHATKPQHGHVQSTSATASPLTPPASAGGSLDGHEGVGPGPKTSFLARRASWLGDLLPGKIARIVTDEWTIDENRMEEVTGLPTRDHWKPDTSTPQCETPACPTIFTLLTRRHHCRRCGRIFCASCSSKAVPLDQHARFHPAGRLARACTSCWVDFGTWERARAERRERRQRREEAGEHEGAIDDSSASDGSDSSDSGSVTPVPGETGDGGTKSGQAKKKSDALVGSIPKDWNWSTF